MAKDSSKRHPHTSLPSRVAIDRSCPVGGCLGQLCNYVQLMKMERENLLSYHMFVTPGVVICLSSEICESIPMLAILMILMTYSSNDHRLTVSQGSLILCICRNEFIIFFTECSCWVCTYTYNLKSFREHFKDQGQVFRSGNVGQLSRFALTQSEHVQLT
jgi:hypothetical protein